MSQIVSELSMHDLNHRFFDLMKSETNAEEAANFIYDHLCEDVILGSLFEFHHGHKTGLTELLEGEPEDEEPFMIVNSPDCDVFGLALLKKVGDSSCACPNCDRLVSASRFAPHLEKCMGMGRNSSRIASRRIASNSQPTSYVGLLSDDDDDLDWSGGSGQNEKRKRRVRNNNNKKTNKMNNKSRCSQHAEEQRRARNVLEPTTPESQVMTGLTADEAGSPPDSSPSSSCSSSSRKRERHRAPPKSKSKRERNASPNRD